MIYHQSKNNFKKETFLNNRLVELTSHRAAQRALVTAFLNNKEQMCFYKFSNIKTFSCLYNTYTCKITFVIVQ